MIPEDAKVPRSITGCCGVFIDTDVFLIGDEQDLCCLMWRLKRDRRGFFFME